MVNQESDNYSSFLQNLSSEDSMGYIKELKDASATMSFGYNVIIPIILFFGFVGNSFNIFIFNRKCMKAVTYQYFRYLSVSDMIAILSWILVCIGNKSEKFEMAIIFVYVYCLAVNTSITLFCAISLERYFSMCMPSKSKAIQHPKFIKILLIIIFILNIVLTVALDSFFFFSWIEYSVYQVFMWIEVVITRFIPSIIIIIINIRLAIQFRKIIQDQVNLIEGSDLKKVRRENRLMAVLLLTAILYVTCEVPFSFFWITNMYEIYSPHTNAVVHIVIAFMEKINFASSFYIYFFTIKKFRHIVLTPIRKKLKTNFVTFKEEDTDTEIEIDINIPDIIDNKQ